MLKVRYIKACECGAWFIQTWKKDEPDTRKLTPFKCRSWRHEGPCRLWKGSQDFVRIREAMDSRSSWSHVVLTFRQRDISLSFQQFRDCVKIWSKMRHRLIWEYGEIEYIQTWERHGSGWPHCHLAISNVAIYAAATLKPKVNFRDLLRRHAVGAGFGPVGWCEPLRNKAAMAGYLVKLARELTGAGVKDQCPTNAPPHFRRLRASRGLLPPVIKNKDYTGQLMSVNSDGEIVKHGTKKE